MHFIKLIMFKIFISQLYQVKNGPALKIPNSGYRLLKEWDKMNPFYLCTKNEKVLIAINHFNLFLNCKESNYPFVPMQANVE